MSQPISPDIVNAVEHIRKATKGLGTDERGLIDSLVQTPNHLLPQVNISINLLSLKPITKQLTENLLMTSLNQKHLETFATY